nr:IS3 family transposase [Ruoffia tabacinasalis]
MVAIPKNSFYEWKAKLSQPEEDLEVNTLIEAIKAIIESSNQSYGYRRVTLALNQRGRKINHKRVLRIMRENQFLCEIPP